MTGARNDRMIKVGPLAFAIDVAVLEDWLTTAEPGDRITYAWGLAAPRSLPAFVRAGELAREGEVRLHNPRRTEGKGFDWIAVKRVPSVGEGAAPAPVADAVEETEEQAVLRILRRAAKMQLVCPTNGEIGRQLGITSEQAAYRFRKLKAAGLTRVEDRGPGQRRVVAIVGTTLETPPGVLS